MVIFQSPPSSDNNVVHELGVFSFVSQANNRWQCAIYWWWIDYGKIQKWRNLKKMRIIIPWIVMNVFSLQCSLAARTFACACSEISFLSWVYVGLASKQTAWQIVKYPGKRKAPQTSFMVLKYLTSETFVVSRWIIAICRGNSQAACKLPARRLSMYHLTRYEFKHSDTCFLTKILHRTRFTQLKSLRLSLRWDINAFSLLCHENFE